MMKTVYSWIKKNKLTSFLILVVLYFLFKNNSNFLTKKSFPNYEPAMMTGEASQPAVGRGGIDALPLYQPAPPTTTKDRLVVRESYISLLVNNVVQIQKQIITTAQSFGGYMVNSNLQNPQDAPTATVIVRVPSDKLNQALEKFRALAVKVISENLSGEDVTDQYVDNQARLTTLEKTKAKFEQILDQATKVEDILSVQRELINLQSQIDTIKGQQKYLEQTAKLAKITIYLSTDELALPYAPSETWRPKVIFKQAIRSLIGSLRKIGTLIIWLIVYSIIWLPILLIILFLRKRKTFHTELVK